MIGTAILLALLSWAGLGFQLHRYRAQELQAKSAGRYAHKLGARQEEIATYESGRAKRKLVARLVAQGQARAAAGGTVAPQSSLQQFRHDVESDADRQLAYDLFGIRYRTWQQRVGAKQAINAAKAASYQAAISTISSELAGGMTMGQGIGSSFIGGGSGAGSFG